MFRAVAHGLLLDHEVIRQEHGDLRMGSTSRKRLVTILLQVLELCFQGRSASPFDRGKKGTLGVPPFPPNRTGGSPASGSPVDGSPSSGVDG